MPVGLTAVVAVLVGASNVLPVSGRGHLALLSALGSDWRDPSVSAAIASGTVVALLAASARRARAALREIAPLVMSVTRLRASPHARDLVGLGVAGAGSVAGAALLGDASSALAKAPLAQGLGMMVTAVMLASTLAAPARTRTHLGTEQTLALGLAQSLAALPGGSVTAAAFAALVWTGVSKRHAVDLALLASVPHAVVGLLGALGAGGAGKRLAENPGEALVVAALSAAGGLAGAALFRRIGERRIAEIAGVEAALAAGLVAYAWTLAGSVA